RTNPLWPELPGGRTDLRYVWEPDAAPEDMRGWYELEDGVIRYARELLDDGDVDRGQLEAIDADIREQVEQAVRFAQDGPLPDPAEAYTGVFFADDRTPPPNDDRPAEPPAGTRELTYAEALVEGLEQLMDEDPQLLIVGSYVLGIGPFRDRFDRI